MTRIIAQNIQVLELPQWSFEIQAGECVYLSGPSGSGKTVLLRAIADLDPNQGSVELDNVSVKKITAHEWRRKVAMVPAETAWWHETVAEHFYQVDKESLIEFGFDSDVMSWEIRRLSTGEKQRLGLLRALQQQPQILLLDEPTANLDQKYTLVLEQYITSLVKYEGLSVIWVTHDLEQQARIANRGWLIEQNEIKEIMI